MRRTWRRRRVLISLAAAFALVAFFGLVAAVILGIGDNAGGAESVSGAPGEPDEVALENSAIQTETEDTAESGAGESEITVADEPGTLATAKTCNALDILVDPNHSLPASYEPQDLVYLQGYGVAVTSGDLPLRREAAKHLGELSVAAKSAGEEVIVSSAYRSYADQRKAFAHYTGIYGDWADHVSAPPGESHHQLGTTVDFTNAEVDYQLIPTFGDTNASRWLSRNAWKYGFVNTYPPGDTDGTGRQAEPWEYRYIGLQTARKVHKSDLSLRQFLEANGQAPCAM